MADTAIAITAGTGTNVDTRTEATNGNHRQVVVLGDPATNAGVAPVDAVKGLAVDLTATGANTTALKVDGSAVTQPVSIATAPVLVAGTALIGKVGTDQTTHGTTDQVASDLTKIAGVAIQGDSLGRQVVLNNTLHSNIVSGVTSDIITTTATACVAGVASNYLYITNILVTNSHATVATFVNITEETSGTVLWTGYAAAAGGGFATASSTPLFKVPTVAKGALVTCVTTGANVRVSMSGFKATI